MQQYQCDNCASKKMIDESPTSGPQKIRTGCDRCKTITSHYAVGRAQWAARQ